MAITKSTIIVEDKLKSLFDYLPLFAINSFSYKPIFMYGDEIELNQFFKSKNNEDIPYPLIWLVYPYVEQHNYSRVKIDKLDFVLAINTNAVMLNDERIEVSYKPLLIPLLDNIRELFRKANIIIVKDNSYIITKFPNYSDSDKNKVVDRWDALKVSLGCTIYDDILKPIVY